MTDITYPKGGVIQHLVLFQQETGKVAYFCQAAPHKLKTFVFALIWTSRQGCRRMLPVKALIHLCWQVRQSRDEFS